MRIILHAHAQLTHAMPKRKRSSLSPPLSNPVASVARQQKLCTECLTSALKPLVSALRLGAGFERQKYSRRKKSAQSNSDAKVQGRLEVEYGVLKTLDLEKVADQHLRKTVGKVKSLRDAEALQSYLNGASGGAEKGYEGRSLAKDPATLNVTARLYKVPAVKKVVDGVVNDLKSIVGVAVVGGDTQSATKRPVQKQKTLARGETESENTQEASDETEDPFTTFGARIAAPSSAEEDSEDSVPDDDRPPSIGDSASEHDPEDDLHAGSEDEEEDSFHGFSSEKDIEETVSKSEQKFPFRTISSSASIDSDSESISDRPIDTVKSNLRVNNNAPTTSSAFIPALSHAAYISGSESEASDLDIDIAPKKNRRGQRARQKIAEAKYGAKAKHLDKIERNKGWDAKRGAVGDRQGPRERGRDRKGPLQSGGNAEPLGQKRSAGVKWDDKGELHPSWQAAKAAKESKKLKIAVAGAKPLGNKVVFD